MKVAAVLPHLKQFGGVRRFLSVGNELMNRGHEYTVYVQDMLWTDWMQYYGQIKSWKDTRKDSGDADVLLIGDPPSFHMIDAVDAKKTYVWVIAGGKYIPMYKAVEKKYTMLLNSSIFWADFPDARVCMGGIDADFFTSRLLRIGYHGRGGKGGDQVFNAVHDLRNIVTIPIEGMKDDEALRDIYRNIDYFVCTEERPGWPNMAVEAMSCGVPVVSSSENTLPLAPHVIQVDSIRAFFEQPVEGFQWGDVTDRLEEIWKEDGLAAI